MPSYPLVAILPDLWTVVEAHTGRPVSQHATLKLAVAHICTLALGNSDKGYTVRQPEHNASAIALARAAIRKAQEAAHSHADTHAMYVTCEHCQLWHHMDGDCPPPPRRMGGFDYRNEP